MTAVKHALTIALFVYAVSACRPSGSDNYLFDASTDQIKIDVIEQNKRITFKAPAGKKITKIKSIATAKDRAGRFTPGIGKKYVSMFSDTDKPVYDIELTLDIDTNCRSATNGVTLTNGSSFIVGCVSQTVLVTQLKNACKELASDPNIASFEETKDSCACLKRVNKTMKYSDYLGRQTSFKIECKNSGTAEQIKALCTEIKERQCPTCVVEAISCQCPKKVTLSYDRFLTNIEDFKNQCENPESTDLKPVDSNLTTSQIKDLFDEECKKVGSLKTETQTASCRCQNGLTVEMADWKKHQPVLVGTCTDELELENGKPTSSEHQDVKEPSGPSPIK